MINMNLPDHYASIEECETNRYREGTPNSRYPHFKQAYFTAGDDEQFKTAFYTRTPLSFDGGEVTPPDNIMNTFYYIYDKLKKGIFVRIYNNELTFLPFSKKNFVNEWSKLIAIKPNFFKELARKDQKNFDPKKFNTDLSKWYANNCLVRYEYPVGENDTNHSLFADMFKTLIRERSIPNVEFFLNRRDFPILTTNRTEPYSELYGDDVPLLSHSYDSYAPILSMCSKPGYADIPIPTCDDWTRICATEQPPRYFVDSLKLYANTYTFGTKWADKKTAGVFRGSSTGIGVDSDTNMRLKISKMKHRLLDAGITKWVLRPRKLKDSPFLQTINTHEYTLVPPLSHEEQSKYKYIINIDGHVCAYRLSLELSMGSVVLLVDSDYSLWFESKLVPYKHFIPIRRDLSNLLSTLQWCESNDALCEQIAKNGVEFYNTYLTKNGVLDYLESLMKSITRTYTHVPPKQKSVALRTLPFIRTIAPFNCDIRSYGACRVIRALRPHLGPLKKGPVIFSNHNSTVIEYTNTELRLCMIEKTHTNPVELMNDLYYSRRVSKLRQYSSTFVYCYGYRESNGVLQSIYYERIQGLTFLSYLQNSFEMGDYLLILAKIVANIELAQNHLRFVHNDLTPWNVMISNGEPIIIDFGKSTSLSKSSPIQDVLSILFTSLSVIFENRSVKNLEPLFFLANFVAGTRYRREPFTERGDLLHFINTNKKYGDFIRSNKYELTTRTPRDFLTYMGVSPPVVEVINGPNECELFEQVTGYSSHAQSPR
jgi:hypothetical protein